MSRKVRKNVGVIGLGIIGTRVAAGLRAAGYQVYVWNRTAKPAPNFLGSPAEVAESADVIQVFVADAQALFDVVEAMSPVLSSRHVIVCNATVGPEAVLEAAQLVEARGAQFLDAPFTGSKTAAEKRQLVYYVGGPDAAFVRARPILELTSKSIIRMGEIGHASTIKVVTNMISAVTAQVLAESLSIVQKAGLEPELLTAAIELNACRSGVIDLKLPKMMSGDYEPHFSLKHMFKDVQLGIHMANALDIEIPATTVTAGVMYGALNRGWGDLDFSVLFKNYTPNDIFEELPALEQAIGSLEAEPELALEGAPAPGPEEPAAKESPASPAEPPSVVVPFAAEPPAVAPVSEPALQSPIALVPEPISVTMEPVTGINGISARELAPAEEAARIIEAVVAHVTAHRRELGTLLQEHRNHGSNPETATVRAKDSGSGSELKNRGESPAATQAKALAEPAPAPGEDPASSESAKDEADEAKSESKPINFVRRWFVGRSQS